MRRDNPIQFAMVREDPEIDILILKTCTPIRHALLIASGGCTALSLQKAFPELQITLLDPNAAQLELIQSKVEALQNTPDPSSLFNIGVDNPNGLNGRGNFESLFRTFRNFIHEFILNRDELLAMFTEESRFTSLRDEMVSSKYWSAAFDTHFNDGLLTAMFGPQATQHAFRGSYPGYFKSAFERALRAPGAQTNYFLHSIFLGHYLKDLPLYLSQPVSVDPHFTYVRGTLDQITDLEKFDFIGLSNIFDWMPEKEVENTVQRLSQEMEEGAVVVYRQLNQNKNFQKLFDASFIFNTSLADELIKIERSFFYSKISIGKKQSKGGFHG